MGRKMVIGDKIEIMIIVVGDYDGEKKCIIDEEGQVAVINIAHKMTEARISGKQESVYNGGIKVKYRIEFEYKLHAMGQFGDTFIGKNGFVWVSEEEIESIMARKNSYA